jgi:hypothetical protein
MINDFVGTWDIVHDDWRGTLVINPSDQKQKAVDGECTYTYWIITGTYTGNDGTPQQVRGTFGGRDPNRRANEACKQSDHIAQFTISPTNQPPQPFVGYLFTHQHRTLAGYTWWQGIPFGWYAVKRS